MTIRIALARAVAHELTGNEQLPYTLAIHAGRDAHGDEHNPHAHLMIREWMRASGFAACVTREVQRLPGRLGARAALEQGRLDKAVTSQLTC
jgi:hypothetical protein